MPLLLPPNNNNNEEPKLKLVFSPKQHTHKLPLDWTRQPVMPYGNGTTRRREQARVIAIQAAEAAQCDPHLRGTSEAAKSDYNISTAHSYRQSQLGPLC